MCNQNVPNKSAIKYVYKRDIYFSLFKKELQKVYFLLQSLTVFDFKQSFSKIVVVSMPFSVTFFVVIFLPPSNLVLVLVFLTPLALGPPKKSSSSKRL